MNSVKRHEFMVKLEKIIDPIFKDEIGKATVLALPKFMFYTGTKISACLDTRIESIIVVGDVWMLKIFDKGQNGKTVWYKIIIGELRDDIEKILGLRVYPSSGYLFDARAYPKSIKPFTCGIW